ncbi:MAG TPA: LuxR C-terminal-related transcriptional regulator [Steroidobacteraceae bacterium]|nr:LuxR C-terminal-related transcriptional regulator [Steroidobacteraceae bacterium]
MNTPTALNNNAAQAQPDVENADAHAGPDWLLVGKLAPPEQRITAASRKALLERLDESLNRALSVIVSPPGFGKTTLLSEWWRALGTRPDLHACWLTVDDLDSEVSRFVAGMILSVARAGVDVGPLEVAARQLSIDLNVRPIALALLEAIRRSGRRAVLILDDFHRAKSTAVDEVVEMLIDHSHGELHLVVSGRARPTFHVSAFLARGMVTQLDAGDLALSLEQASQVVGPNVSPADLALLHARTEGWAVALQLARLWLEKGRHKPDALKNFSGRTTEMTDYLAEQLVADLPESLRDFLLETSILERFNAPLADAVRDRSDSNELLEKLRHFDALLVPLDDTREWFRYHHLFADFLCQRLKRSSAPRLAVLRRRAARALAAIGDLPEAVQHAVAADDIALAMVLTQQAGGWELILWKGIGYVRSLLKCFNELTIRSEVTLQLTQAYLHIKLARFDAARELLALTETMLETAPPRALRDYTIVQDLWTGYMDHIGRSDWQSVVDAHIRSLEPGDHLGRGTLYCERAVTALAWGALDQVEAESRRAIQEMRASGSILGVNYAFMHLALGQLLAGRLREAEMLYREALSMAEENFGADSGLKALCRFFVGYCLYLKGDHESSGPLIESWIETTDGWLDVFATAYEVTARQAFDRGGLNEATAILGEANRVAQERRLERLVKLTCAWRVEFLTLAGRHADAKREAGVGGVFGAAESRGPPDFGWRARFAATVAIGRLWAATGSAAQALQLVDAARAEFRAAKLLLPARRLDALSIVILKQRGADEEALVRLQDLLDFVVAEGAIGILLEHGRSLEGLLNIAQRRNRELILSSAQRDIITQVLGRLQRAALVDQDGFSARELAVLRELCNGRSNKAIGQVLDLSENTVKFHLKRIFKKLGAESRAAAITAALQRNLVISDDINRGR